MHGAYVTKPKGPPLPLNDKPNPYFLNRTQPHADCKQIWSYDLYGKQQDPSKIYFFLHGFPDGPGIHMPLIEKLLKADNSIGVCNICLPHYEERSHKKDWPVFGPGDTFTNLVEQLDATVAAVLVDVYNVRVNGSNDSGAESNPDLRPDIILVGHDWGGNLFHALHNGYTLPSKGFQNKFRPSCLALPADRMVLVDVTISMYPLASLPMLLIYGHTLAFLAFLPWAIFKVISDKARMLWKMDVADYYKLSTISAIALHMTTGPLRFPLLCLDSVCFVIYVALYYMVATPYLWLMGAIIMRVPGMAQTLKPFGCAFGLCCIRGESGGDADLKESGAYYRNPNCGPQMNWIYWKFIGTNEALLRQLNLHKLHEPGNGFSFAPDIPVFFVHGARRHLPWWFHDSQWLKHDTVTPYGIKSGHWCLDTHRSEYWTAVKDFMLTGSAARSCQKGTTVALTILEPDEKSMSEKEAVSKSGLPDECIGATHDASLAELHLNIKSSD